MKKIIIGMMLSTLSLNHVYSANNDYTQEEYSKLKFSNIPLGTIFDFQESVYIEANSWKTELLGNHSCYLQHEQFEKRKVIQAGRMFRVVARASTKRVDLESVENSKKKITLYCGDDRMSLPVFEDKLRETINMNLSSYRAF